MNRSILIIIGILFMSAWVSGQDILITRDAEEINAKVLTVSDTEVSYQLKGQTVKRIISIDKLFMIKYANGEKDVFQLQSSPKAEEVNNTDTHYYKLLELYDVNGVRGVVVEVQDNGLHGKLLSLDEGFCRFVKDDVSVMPEMSSTSDGQENRKYLDDLLQENPELSIADFPAHHWCAVHGKGWYLPSIDELMAVKKLFHGNKYQADEVSETVFQNALQRNGGIPLKVTKTGKAVYFSSTTKGKWIRGLQFRYEKACPDGVYPNEVRFTKWHVRAMYQF